MKKTLIALALVASQVALATEQVPNVYVNNSLSHRFSSSSDTTLPTQTITKQQIKQSGAVNLAQVLSYAGLQVHTLGGLGSQATINFRGFGDNAGQNSLILLNGQPLTNPDLGNYNFDTIPLSLISKVEIQPGSAGVLYGDQAVGGVIDIITRPIAEKSQQFEASAGSFNTLQQQASLSRQFKKNNRVRANFYHVTTDNYRDRDNFRNSAIDLAGSKHWQQGQVNLEYLANHSHQQYPGALTYQQVHSNRRQAQNPHDYNAQTNQDFNAHYRQTLNSNWQVKLDGLYNTMNGDGQLTNDYKKHRYSVNLSPSLQGLITLGQLELMPNLGIQLNQGQYQFSSSSYDSKATQTSSSEFANVNIPLWSHWTLLAGARYAQASTKLDSTISNLSQRMRANNYAFVTSLGLSWQINTTLRTYLRRAGSYRFPKTDEDINTNTGEPLKTQTGVSYEAGLVWQQAHWSGLFDIYQLNLKNEITAIPIPNSTTTYAENQNLKPTSRTGLSINSSYQLVKPLNITLIYRYVDAKFQSGPDKGNRIPFVAENTFTANLSYRFLSHWTATFETNLIGNRTYANDPEQRDPLLGGYTVYNFNLSYQWRWLTANLKLNNLTDKHYFDYAFAMYNGDQTDNYYYPAAGRSVLLSLAVKL